MQNLDLLTNDLQVSPASQSFLHEAARWGKFLSVIGFILSGLLAIGSFFAPALYSKFSSFNQISPEVQGTTGIIITIIYLLFAILMFIPCLYLNKFSVKMKTALNTVDQSNFDDSFKNLKSLFKFYGIFTIILLSFYGIVFIVAMLGIALR